MQKHELEGAAAGLVLPRRHCYHHRMQPTVALCMIVRDEQATLARCLMSVAAAVDAIYITDTGSTDDTVAIARAHGANIRHFTWCDDFSAARNHSIENVPEDWLLILDADDYFPPGEAARLCTLLKDSSALSFTVEYIVMEGYTPASTRRLLRNHRGLRFEGLIHESVRARLPKTDPAHTAHTDIRLHHLGYTATSLPAKLRRNLPLLQKEWDRCQNGPDPCQRLHIGKELAQTQMELGEPAAGEQLLKTLLRDWPEGEVENHFALEALAALLWHYLETGREHAAWQLCESVKPKLANEPAFPLYRGLTAFRTQRFMEALADLTSFEQHWLAGQVRIPVPISYTGLALWDLQGQCCLSMGRASEAARLFTKCLSTGGDAKEYEIKLHLARQLSVS